jgi:two-component system nitrate/nitrite response regulator NarL
VRGPNQRNRSIPTVIFAESALFRAGLTHILAGTRFRIMPGCASLKDIQKGALLPACLVLVGLDEGAWAVLSEVSFLKAKHQSLRVVLFSDGFDLEEFLTGIASGGDCYLLKNEISPDALLKSLELVLVGQTIVPLGVMNLIRSQVRPQQEALSPDNYPEVRSEHLPSQFPIDAPQTDDHVRLSNREQTILLHLTQGVSNKHIARELKLAEATVKAHVKALLGKLGARNRTQAAIWAVYHLKSSRLEEPKSSKRSAGLPVLLGQLGRLADLGLDIADEPLAARQTEQETHAVP